MTSDITNSSDSENVGSRASSPQRDHAPTGGADATAPALVDCEQCAGTGNVFIGSNVTTCAACKGTGKVVPVQAKFMPMAGANLTYADFVKQESAKSSKTVPEKIKDGVASIFGIGSRQTSQKQADEKEAKRMATEMINNKWYFRNSIHSFLIPSSKPIFTFKRFNEIQI